MRAGATGVASRVSHCHALLPRRTGPSLSRAATPSTLPDRYPHGERLFGQCARVAGACERAGVR